MHTLLDVIVKIWGLLRKPMVVFFSIAVLFLFGLQLFSQPRITGDTASHILLSVAPLLDIGSPYKDFWEIKPPVWPFVVYLWSSVLGFGVLSIKIFNLMLAIVLAVCMYLIYKKIYKTPILEIFYGFTLLINLSPLLNTLILPTEILGLCLSLCALLLLISAKNEFSKFYLSGILFFLASQSKEPYTFTIISAVPVFLIILLEKDYVRLVKNIFQFMLGIFSGFIVLFSYLLSSGSLKAYFQVFQFKSVFFPFNLERMSRNLNPAITATNNTFIEFSGGILTLILLAFLIFLLSNKFKKTLMYKTKTGLFTSKPIAILNNDNVAKYAVALYALGSFLGFGLGGVFGSHYLIQAVIPFYLLCSLIVSYIYSEFTFLFKKGTKYVLVGFIILLFSLIIVLPKRQYISSYLPKNIDLAFEDDIYSYEKRVTELTTRNECIISVYGWGVSENYLYAQRRPCTRFFLANMVKLDWQRDEYRESIMSSPPALIVYTPNGADMDVEGFERDVINMGRIVKNCYIEDTEEKIVFVPKTKNSTMLKDCIKDNSKTDH